MQQESMFGPSPLAVQDQLDQQFLNQNSSLDLGSLSARAGLAMGKGINGLLGREDPRVAEAKAVQEAVQELRSSGATLDNPEEYYKKMAGIFGAKGLTKQAEQAAMKALEYKDKAEERAFKTKDRDMQLQIKSGELAIKQAQLQKEIAKASTKAGGLQLIQILKDGFANSQLDQESISRALVEFNRDGGTLESALALLKNKEDKAAEKWSDPYDINVNGKVVRVQKNTVTGAEKAVAGNEANIRNTTNVSTGLKEFTGEHNIISKGLDDVKKVREQLASIRSAMAVNAKDDATSQNAADVLIAKAIQPGGVLSNQDINRTLGAGDFATRVADKLSRLVDGRPTKFTQAERAALLKLMEREMVKEHNNIQALPRKAAERAQYNPDEFFRNEVETPEPGKNGLKASTQAILEEERKKRGAK